MPIAAAPIMTAGSTGDSGDEVGQGVGIVIVDVLIVVAVVTGAAGVVSSVIWLETGVSTLIKITDLNECFPYWVDLRGF